MCQIKKIGKSKNVYLTLSRYRMLLTTAVFALSFRFLASILLFNWVLR